MALLMTGPGWPASIASVAPPEFAAASAARVADNATKIDVRRAVEEIYKVKVQDVNTSAVQGKLKRVRFKTGYTSGWKKAVVTLRQGQKIEGV